MSSILNGIINVIMKGKLLVYMKWAIIYALKGNWSLGTEMAYWDNELNNNRPKDWIQPMHDDIRPAIDLLRETFQGHLKVLELGSGPRSRLTEGYREGLYDLVGIDPLAEDFKKYLDGEDFLIHGFGESMDGMYPHQSFHMCYASNVLDHSKNPQQCFRNMVKLAKIGGLIMVQGNINEGERTSWGGLHKYNMWVEEEKLMCSTRSGAPINLTKGLPLKRVATRHILLDGNPWFSVMYRRSN